MKILELKLSCVGVNFTFVLSLEKVTFTSCLKHYTRHSHHGTWTLDLQHTRHVR